MSYLELHYQQALAGQPLPSEGHKPTHAITVDPTPTRTCPMPAAYGGQFAFLEIMSSMRTPNNFSKAVMMCTGIMTALYGGFGAIG